MGDYITQATLEQRMTPGTLYGLLQDVPMDQRATVVEQIIDRAEGRINGYAGRKYQIPLTYTGCIEEWSFVIAEYELYKRSQGNDVPAKYKASFDDVVKLLKDVADGLFLIPDQVKLTRGSSIRIQSDLPLFSEQEWYDYDDDYRETLSE